MDDDLKSMYESILIHHFTVEVPFPLKCKIIIYSQDVFLLCPSVRTCGREVEFVITYSHSHVFPSAKKLKSLALTHISAL